MIKKMLRIVAVLLVAATAYAEFYEVNVTRVEQNLYRDTLSRAFIVTRYCYQYAYSEDAILSYEAYSYNNKLIFEDGTSCDVVKVTK
jgi:hypothetical protein